MSAGLQEELAAFAVQQRFRGKGPLSVALVVTDHARTLGLPLSPDALLTEGGGQVIGLGKAKVQEILSRHQITRVLAEEAGRTSRGSIGKMRKYAAWLNAASIARADFDLGVIESFWIEQVRSFFLGKPFSLAFDHQFSLRAVIGGLIAQAEKRQKDMPGTTFAGTMMQHLVGAKLELILAGGIRHESASASDESTSRSGDFNIQSMALHVTVAPTEALMRKCRANIENGLRPIIVTTGKGVALAKLNAEQFEIAERVEIIEIEQWLASNVLEWGEFSEDGRRTKMQSLIETYNRIVDQVESDPSLRIEASASRG